MSRNFSLDSISQTIFNGSRSNNFQFENRVIITANVTFKVPPNTKVIKFSAVGGGRPAVGQTGGPGGGYFEKTFYAPFTGLTTSFQLTVGAAGGNASLANSAGTTIATAYGATAISATNPIGIGGTSEGGDLNTNGSPGGTNPGCGGASGGCFGDSEYSLTYAGRWIYLKESFTNDNVKNFMLANYYINGGPSIAAASFGPSSASPTRYHGVVYSAPSDPTGSPGGLFCNGSTGGGQPSPFPSEGGSGGYGADGGVGGVQGGPTGVGGVGGVGGTGGNGGPGVPSGNGGAGGAGGFGAPGGNGGSSGSPSSYGGVGGFGGAGGSGGGGPGAGSAAGGGGGGGGFGGGGGKGGAGGPLSPSPGGTGGTGGYGGGGGSGGLNPVPVGGGYGTAGGGGACAFIVEWTTSLPNKTGV